MKRFFCLAEVEIYGKNCVVRTLFTDVRAAGCVAEGNTYLPTATFHVKGVEKPLDLTAWRALGLDVE